MAGVYVTGYRRFSTSVIMTVGCCVKSLSSCRSISLRPYESDGMEMEEGWPPVSESMTYAS
jgi:hypothetical protein